MSGFLRNVKEFNEYMIDVVYNGNQFRRAKRSYLRNYDFVKERKEVLIYIMISQWMKLEVKEFLLEDKNHIYLKKVHELGEDDSNWHKQIFGTGQAFFDFDKELMYPDFYDDLAKIKDYLYGICESYLDNAIANKELVHNMLKKEPKFSTFEKVLKLANQWHYETYYKDYKENTDAIDYGGTEDVLKFKNGYKIVLLKTPEALDAEGEMMGHSAGEGGYDKGVLDGSLQIYSLRDNEGRAKVSMEVRDKKVYQCKGKQDKAPAREYVIYIQAFVNQLKLAPQFDIRNMGLVRGSDNLYYNIFNLPLEFECDNLDLRGLDLKGFIMPKILRAKSVNISGAYNLPKVLDFKHCGDLIFARHHFSDVDLIVFPKGEKVSFVAEVSLPKVIDLSHSGIVEFNNCDFRNVLEIKFPVGKKVLLNETWNLPKKLDFSMCGYVDISWNNFKGVEEILFAKDGDVNLSKSRNMPLKLDLSRAGNVDLNNTDFARTKKIMFPMGQNVNVDKAISLPEILDFGNCGDLKISRCNLYRVKKIVFPAKHKVDLSDTKNLPADLNFKNCEAVVFNNTNFKGVKNIELPVDEDVDFSNAFNFPPFINLTQIKSVIFSNADMSGIKEMLVPSDNPSFEIKGAHHFPAKRVKKMTILQGANIKRGFFAKLFS